MHNPYARHFYSNNNPAPPTPQHEMDKAIQEFLSSGGVIQHMRDDGGSYEKNLKKTQKNLVGGFNPFSKSDALTINKGDLIRR